MPSFHFKKSVGFLCCLAGLLFVVGLISLPAIIPGVVEARTQLPEYTKPATPTAQAPALPDAVPGPSTLLLHQPQQAELRETAVAPTTAIPPRTQGTSSQEMMRSRSIDQLLEHLQVLRAQKAELERQEKEVVAAVKERLLEQKQKLQTLGVQLEEVPGQPRSESPRFDSPRIGN